ncbi:SDR family NAD(P)-dependent oxidoreductase [Novosphingobium lentum]|uniref:SDR family NAD(P)-dependent oxidoreductase n=1 Tax=Novosphingobium lentum TaxID=145287 RepID=UPI00082EBB48|nr:glucose 1-dehydrogenase [Novosphingobium lentum]
MSGFAGKVALVTGAASGIGEACARALAAAGAQVVLTDLMLDGALRVARDIGASAEAFAADVSAEDQCDAMVAFAVERFGRLDIAVNNAGVGNKDRSHVADLATASWRHVLGVNLDGVFFSMRAEIRAMIASGGDKSDGRSIVNIASVMGSVAVECGSAYVTAKHGVVGLTKAAALDHAADGIRVNAVGPGYVDTAMFADRTPEQRAEVGARHPLGRIARPDEIAAMVTFLASPAASFATGGYYPVDGGYLAR